MNKKLPEDIMSKIEQEAEMEASMHFNKEYSKDQWQACVHVYIAGRTASVQPLIDLIRECEEYLSQRHYVHGAPIQLNSIGAGSILHTKMKTILSSFPSSPKPIEGGLRWIKAVDRMPGLHKEVKWRSDLLDIPDQPMWMEAVLHNYGHVQSSLEWLSESPNNTGEWISLEENNFEVDKPYLLHGTDWPYPVVGEYWKIPGDTGWHEKSSGYVLFNVSHFQSLPEPPKQ